MVRTIPPSIFQFIGTVTNGDLGPYTMYTSRRKRLVVFPKSWPKDPASYNQKLNRDKWRHAGLRWRSLPQAVKDDWERLSKKANLTITGYNLFLFYLLNKGRKTVEACERISGVNVIAATGPPLPYLEI